MSSRTTALSTRRLGASDVEASVLGIGCNAFGARTDADEVVAIVDAAIEHGVTFFDTADVYSLGESETLLGRAIQGRRDDVVIATKFGMDMQGVNGDDQGSRGRPEYVRTAVEASLRRLGVEHIDLYQLHTPDPSTPIADTLGALHELVEAGTVRAIGCSNFQAWQLVNAQWTAKDSGATPFVTAQNEYSLYNRTAEVELTPACEAFDVSILPYFPLAYGLLTGKYRRDEAAPTGSRLEQQSQRLEDADWDTVDALQQLADANDVSLLDLAIGGLAAQPAVGSVIAGVSRPSQVATNAAAASWAPGQTLLDALAQIGRPTQSYTTFAP